MAKVHILNVNVHNNPAPFFTPFQFEIHFECLEDLQDDLEFKIIYVGSAETIEFDQTLDQIVVDAVPKGQFKFMFQAEPPDITKIPADDAVGVTVVLITATYKDQEFVRVGYYVNNEYEEPELKENPPAEPIFEKLIRQIVSDQPRVTKFKINWEPASKSGASEAAAQPSNTLVTYFNGQDSEMADDTSNKLNPNETNSEIQNKSSEQGGSFENKENLSKQNSNSQLKLDNPDLIEQQKEKNNNSLEIASNQNVNSENCIENGINDAMS